ncbi:hypothetical protein RF11_15886 [Thelohanellus kitauei]|uniref:Uncharacterized protein n=1 Tax=Thelohanellus kitauei TaxID=669202 RepID=A0A0C2MWY6_THEKT|nr:hypothetical protein RF11_15886 [Thelohanellus kitauei]
MLETYGIKSISITGVPSQITTRPDSESIQLYSFTAVEQTELLQGSPRQENEDTYIDKNNSLYRPNDFTGNIQPIEGVPYETEEDLFKLMGDTTNVNDILPLDVQITRDLSYFAECINQKLLNGYRPLCFIALSY